MNAKKLILFSVAFASFYIVQQLPAHTHAAELPPPYVQDKQQELSAHLAQLPSGMLKTGTEESSLLELIRILKKTRNTYDAINHYSYGWKSIMNYQYQANLNAVRKGIAVSRTFILSDEILNEPEELSQLLETMQQQHRDGIHVRYGFQHELDTDPDYQRYKYIDAGLSDNAVFARVTAVSLYGPQPAHVEIIWNPALFAPLNPFPFLKKSKYIHEFGNSSAAAITTTAAERFSKNK